MPRTVIVFFFELGRETPEHDGLLMSCNDINLDPGDYPIIIKLRVGKDNVIFGLNFSATALLEVQYGNPDKSG